MIVVDTNLIVALTTKHVESRLADTIQKRDNEWLAPPLWESEYRNVMLALIRAGVTGPAAALASYKMAVESVQTMPVSTAAVLRIAEAHGLTAYDAEFASLAEWLEIPCLSFDTDLLKVGLATHPKDY